MIGTASSVINKPKEAGNIINVQAEPFSIDYDEYDDDDEELLMAQNVLAMLTMVLEDEENGVEIEEI